MKDKFIPPSPLTTPVLFIIFNRTDTTQKVFNAIRKAKPKQLFIAADGPRPDKEGEKEKCEQVRKIIEQVDWDCELNKNYSDVNLGCKIRPSSGIDWFFENVEEGIILEDDCLPSQSFFWFCQELLEYYRNCTMIMNISGNNFQFGIQRGSADYYFSIYNQTWGWATWKRAWRFYDINMKSFNKFRKENQIKNVFRTKQEQNYWMRTFQIAYDGKIDAWDYQWLYSRIVAGGLSIHPNVNLVQNIGFRSDATHTFDVDIRVKNNYAKEIKFPLKHPKFILIDEDADKFIFKDRYYRNILVRIKNKIKRFLS